MRRKMMINGQPFSHVYHLPWISLATVFGLPATSAPLGLGADNLPVNVQIIGGAYQDKTTLKFASLLADVMGGFSVPPGYLDDHDD